MMLPSPFPNIHKDLFNEVIAASIKDCMIKHKPIMDLIKDKLDKELDNTIGGYRFKHITFGNINDINGREKIFTRYTHLIFEHSIFSRKQIYKMKEAEYCQTFEQILKAKDVVSLVFVLSFPLDYGAFKPNYLNVETTAHIVCYYWLNYKRFLESKYLLNYKDYLKMEKSVFEFLKLYLV